MADNGEAQDWKFWYRDQVTRRRLVGWSAGALGAAMLVPAPWRAAFGAEKPYKIGSLQPLSGAGAAGGKTALVGVQMAVDRINRSGGINGRPLELVVADDESKPDVGARPRSLQLKIRSTPMSAAFCPISAWPACLSSRRPRWST